VTQASFLRAASASYHTVPKKLTSALLSAFRSKKGSYDGNTSSIFHGAYVYLEKLSIKKGNRKSPKREEMEAIHGKDGGLNTERRQDRITCAASDSWHNDMYGRSVIDSKVYN
jgi:hypothetical protein